MVRLRSSSSPYSTPRLGTVEEYQREFEKLMNWVTDIPETFLIYFYVSGLKLHIQRELLVSRPASLGDAFALARIAEARLEDQTAPTTASKVAAVYELLMEQNEVTRQLKQNLLAAILRMEEKANRTSSEMVTEFPDEFKEGQPMEQPVGVYDSRMVLQNGNYERQVLVQWAGRSPEEVT
ncbi:hypothetical protein Tco_1067564 [Tanacetum coccineum]|uniref:Uncharacterized protein n=1 Tax=Tanacetum coccineum TaxID=301880 RepID=A0ABQ5HDA9_9ASTR